MILEQVAQFLQSKELGIFDPLGTTGNMFIHALPSKPDEVICLYTNGGSNSLHLCCDSDYFNQDIQIIVRGNLNGKAAGEKAYAVYRSLNNYHGYLVAGGNYVSQILSYPPASIGADSNGRLEFSISMSIRLEEVK